MCYDTFHRVHNSKSQAYLALTEQQQSEPVDKEQSRITSGRIGQTQVALKMRLVKTLVWTVLYYGAEAWALKMRDEQKITSTEMWLWRRMKRIRWMQKRNDNSILQEIDIKASCLDTLANVNYHTLDTFAESMAARLLKL